MLKYSTEIVNTFSYKLLKDNYYEVYLRENIAQLDNRYSFNEYSLIVKSDNIENDITNNFDIYLENAKLNEELTNTQNEIKNLKKLLTDSDYQIIKCAENFMIGSVLPYDFSQLLYNRIDIRNKINNLQGSTEENSIEEEKNKKIIEMCAICQTTITSGIDYNNEHYRLNTTDQINLTSLYSLAQLGQSVPYHADGKVCRIYTSEEMTRLVQTATKWVIYHTTYYNLLKHQIQDMTDIEEVKKVEYGTELSSEYQTILNTILTQ